MPLIASETLLAGANVNVFDAGGGNFQVRMADSAKGYAATGFVLSGVAAGAPAPVRTGGVNTALSGLSPGLCYLGPRGSTVSAAPTDGTLVQVVGVQQTPQSMLFQPGAGGTGPGSGSGTSTGTTNNTSLTFATGSGSEWWVELNGAAVSPSGFTGPSRSSGGTAGQPAPYGYVQAVVQSSVAGTLTIVNEAAPALSAPVPIPAGAVATVKAPAFGGAFHAAFTPSAAATVSLAIGFTQT